MSETKCRFLYFFCVTCNIHHRWANSHSQIAKHAPPTPILHTQTLRIVSGETYFVCWLCIHSPSNNSHDHYGSKLHSPPFFFNCMGNKHCWTECRILDHVDGTITVERTPLPLWIYEMVQILVDPRELLRRLMTLWSFQMLHWVIAPKAIYIRSSQCGLLEMLLSYGSHCPLSVLAGTGGSWIPTTSER